MKINKKISKKILVLTAIITAVYVLTPKTPKDNKNWQDGQKIKSSFTFENEQFTVHNLRNWEFDKNGPIKTEYIKSKTYNLNDIKTVWFLVEPFSKWEAIAHTYFVFDFENNNSLALSVESRREQKESYNPLLGVLNKYELIYIWGTEKDITGQRAVWGKEKIYMIPLQLNHQQKTTLLQVLINDTNKLYNTPQFYNTLTSNCTNNLAKAANQVKPGAIPKIYYLSLPGSSIQVLKNLGYIKNLPTKTLKEKYFITNIFTENYNNPNLNQIVREYISKN